MVIIRKIVLTSKTSEQLLMWAVASLKVGDTYTRSAPIGLGANESSVYRQTRAIIHKKNKNPNIQHKKDEKTFIYNPNI